MNPWAAAFLGLATALVPALVTVGITHYLTRRRELDLRISEEKRRRYEELVSGLRKGFLDSRLTEAEQIVAKEEYYLQSYVVWLYASDEVIRRLNDFAHQFAEWDADRSEERRQKVADALNKLVHAMRVDTRGKTQLQPRDFVTTTVRDVSLA